MTDRGDPDNCGPPTDECGGPLSSETKTIGISVRPDNETPVAEDGSFRTHEDVAIEFDLASLVNDAETADSDLTYSILDTTRNGVLAGSGPILAYAPDADFNGQDTFTYTVTDRGDPDDCGVPSIGCAAAQTSDIKTVTIIVDPVNAPPLANDFIVSTDENNATEIGLALLVSDEETSDADLVYTIVSSVSHGVLTGTGPDFTYTPALNFNGSDTFTYSVTDRGDPDNCVPGDDCAAALTSDVKTVTIEVRPVNSSPSAEDGSFGTEEDVPAAIDLDSLVEDLETTDADLTYTIIETTVNGNLTGAAPNFTYTPFAHFYGEDMFTYSVTDRGDPDNCGEPGASCAAAATSEIRTVTITVQSVNDAPIAGDDGGVGFTTFKEAAFVTANVLDNDTDVDSEGQLSVVLNDATSVRGILVSNGDGTFDYDPNGQFDFLTLGESATEVFTYDVIDETGLRDTGTVTITIGVDPVLRYAAPADNGPDDLTLRLGGLLLEVFDNNTSETVASKRLSDTGSVVITGADGEDDQLLIDFASGGFFELRDGISFSGGENGTDSFRILGNESITGQYVPLGTTLGEAAITASVGNRTTTADFMGVEPVSISALGSFLFDGAVNVGDQTLTLDLSTFASLGPVTTLSGGTISAIGGLALGPGDSLTGNGDVNARIFASGSSTIIATGDFNLGLPTAFDGFFSEGVLEINQHAVTIHDRDAAVLGTLTRIGNDVGPGSLTSPNGLLLEDGKTVDGYGLVSGDFENQGLVVGEGPQDSNVLEFAGNVIGRGDFSGNILFSGSFSSGDDPAIVSFENNVTFASASSFAVKLGLSEHDSLAVGDMATLAGTLNVRQIEGFQPQPGDAFVIVSGQHTGQFESINDNSPLAGLWYVVDYDDPQSVVLRRWPCLATPIWTVGSMRWTSTS